MRAYIGESPHDTSEAGDPAGNGIAERQIQEVKLGTACNLSQAGLPHRYWDFAMRHWVMANNLRLRHYEATPERGVTPCTSLCSVSMAEAP